MHSIIAPKCINNNNCLNVCNVKICKNIPFMCGDAQCECLIIHSKCMTTIKWNSIKELLQNKLRQSSIELIQYFTQIQDLYKGIIKQIEKSLDLIKYNWNSFGLTQTEKDTYEKLKQKKYTEFNGQMINKLESDLFKQKKELEIQNISKQKQQVEKQTLNLINSLENIAMNKHKDQKQMNVIQKIQRKLIMSSKISGDVKSIENLFPNKKIVKMNLLYRASENQFQITKFKDKCNGKKNTITILKTQFGNIIGAYTPLPWAKDLHDQYSKDESKQSFIFSLTNKHKFKLKEQKQKYAIYHNKDWGPYFGGADLRIADKANNNVDSGANIGNSYNHSEYTWNDQQSRRKFSGQEDGWGFKVQQWQVYQVIFDDTR